MDTQRIKGNQQQQSIGNLFKRFKMVDFQEHHIEESFELLVSSTLELSPIYIALGIEKKTIIKSFRSCLEDKRNWKHSFVVLDTEKNNKIAGVKIITDLTHVEQELKPTGCLKKDYKEKIDQELMQYYFDQNYKEGECAFVLAFNVSKEYQGSGVAVLMCVELVARCVMAGYKNLINIMYNKASIMIGKKYFGGQITKQIDLSERLFEGQPILKGAKGLDYGCLWYNDLTNKEEIDTFLGVQQLIAAKNKALKQKISIQNEQQLQPKL